MICRAILRLFSVMCIALVVSCAPPKDAPQPQSQTTAPTKSKCVVESWGKLFLPDPQTFEKLPVIETDFGTVLPFKFGPIKGEYGKSFLFFLEGEECFAKAVVIGSYEATTQISRELGKIPADARVYHADLYLPGVHQTLGFFDKPPAYDAARKIALGALR